MWYTARRIFPPLSDYDVIVVLGAQVQQNGEPSVQLEWRLDTAVRMYNAVPCPVIVCGAQGADEPRPEADVMRDLLVADGIPADRIYVDSVSRDTYQNIRNAKEIIEQLGLSRPLIITSDYHLRPGDGDREDGGLRCAGRGEPHPAGARVLAAKPRARGARLGEVLADPLRGAESVTDAEKRALIRSRLDALGLACPADASGKLCKYQAMLEEWNARVNLTGDAAFDSLLDRHLADSLTPLTVGGLLPGNASVIDVGSGAGLPGIPLAIVRPDLRITLLDSLKKRVAFLEAVITALGLSNVAAVHARAEDAARDTRYRERFDVALARAVAALPVLAELLLPFVKVGGVWLCYKGPSMEDGACGWAGGG